jgi:transcriptional antiterminator NusG
MTSLSPASVRWYAVRTMPNRESAVNQMLEDKGYERLLPTYRTRVRWADRVKELERPLFPGYLFCRFDARERVPVLNTPGVIDIVRVAGHPAPVDEDQLASVRAAIESGYTCLPCPYAEIGKEIKIGFGPLAGVSGVLVEIKRTLRLVLSVSNLNLAMMVEVDADALAPREPCAVTDEASVRRFRAIQFGPVREIERKHAQRTPMPLRMIS